MCPLHPTPKGYPQKQHIHILAIWGLPKFKLLLPGGSGDSVAQVSRLGRSGLGSSEAASLGRCARRGEGDASRLDEVLSGAGAASATVFGDPKASMDGPGVLGHVLRYTCFWEGFRVYLELGKKRGPGNSSDRMLFVLEGVMPTPGNRRRYLP